jgi:hypothetical protein
MLVSNKDWKVNLDAHLRRLIIRVHMSKVDFRASCIPRFVAEKLHKIHIFLEGGETKQKRNEVIILFALMIGS